MSEKINLPRIFLCMIILSVLFIGQISCSEQGVNTISEQEIDISESLISEDAKEVISLLGFNAEGAKEVGDYFVVEDDVAISRRIVEEGLRSCTDIRTRAKSGDVSIGDSVQVAVEEMKQWVTNSTLVGINKVANMTYKIDSSIPSNRHGIIHQAVNIWNSVSGSRLDLTGDSTADIIIYAMGSAPSPYTCLNTMAWGTAIFPSNGNPGPAITVEPTLSDFWLRSVTVHELGHTFGFRHTDWQGHETQSGTSSCGVNFNAHHIAHTPSGTGNPDPNSIMNRGSTNQGLPLTTSDEVALRVMYPDNTKPVITNVNDMYAPEEYYIEHPIPNQGQQVELWQNDGSTGWQYFSTYNSTLASLPYVNASGINPNNLSFRIRYKSFAGHNGPFSDPVPAQ